jgi:hypothetical protein
MVQKPAELPIFLKHVVGAANMGIKYGETASVCGFSTSSFSPKNKKGISKFDKNVLKVSFN